MAIKKEKIGILIGGGPAPGINGVISSATIKAINEGKDVIGINGGFKSLFVRDKNCLFPLTIEDVSRIHTQGGSILRTSRYPQDKAKENFKTLMSVLIKTGIKYLITIVRLEREDFEDKNLFHLAKFSKLNPNQFKKMFGYIV